MRNMPESLRDEKTWYIQAWVLMEPEGVGWIWLRIRYSYDLLWSQE